MLIKTLLLQSLSGRFLPAPLPISLSLLGATFLPVRLFEMKELMSILVVIYLLGMLFLPISSYLGQTTSAMAIPSLARMLRFSALVFRGPFPK